MRNLRRHGVIGGPRRRTSKPKASPIEKLPKPFVSSPEVVIVQKEEKEEIRQEEYKVFLEEEINEEIELESEESEAEEAFISTGNKLVCSVCGYEAKSKRGLKAHKRIHFSS